MKIIIKMQGKEKTLTIEEAREVYSELRQLFGDKETVYVPNPYPVIYPKYPTYPIITYTTEDSSDADNNWKLLY